MNTNEHESQKGARTMTQPRQPGTKRDIVVFANPEDYASFPQLARTDDPGSYDMGYPVATQCPDGSIVCAFYGYSTADVGEKMPHGIFVSVFDEVWMTNERTTAQ